MDYPMFDIEPLRQNGGRCAIVFDNMAEAGLFLAFIKEQHPEIKPLTEVRWDNDRRDEKTAYNIFDKTHFSKGDKYSSRMGFCREGWYRDSGWLLFSYQELLVSDFDDEIDADDIDFSDLLI